MKANETTLRNLLQGERQYVVPLYQRPYSWERRDLQQLWNDLLAVVESGGSSSHFLGSVVLGLGGWMTLRQFLKTSRAPPPLAPVARQTPAGKTPTG